MGPPYNIILENSPCRFNQYAFHPLNLLSSKVNSAMYNRIHLTSTNVDVRCSATSLLSDVLESLSKTQHILPDDSECYANVCAGVQQPDPVPDKQDS